MTGPQFIRFSWSWSHNTPELANSETLCCDSICCPVYIVFICTIFFCFCASVVSLNFRTIKCVDDFEVTLLIKVAVLFDMP